MSTILLSKSLNKKIFSTFKSIVWLETSIYCSPEHEILPLKFNEIFIV